MSNYLPRTQKKRLRQLRVEADLKRLFANKASLDKLIAAAENLRGARIRAIKALRQHCCLIGSAEKYDSEIATLQKLDVAMILREFTDPPLTGN